MARGRTPLSPSIAITPRGPLNATIRPPGSKSITNRALVCAALAAGRSTLSGALDSDDTRVMVDCLRKLGIAVDHSAEARTLTVDGCGGRISAREADLFVGNSGTTVRFLTALVTLGRGVYRLDGVARMRERPIEDQLDALRQLGAKLTCELGTGCPPVRVEANGLPGGKSRVRGDVSSQFLSGLLMTAPCALSDVELSVDGVLVSQPYIHMTLAVMRSFGIAVEIAPDLSHFKIRGARRYEPREYAIEPDASAASYFFGAAAIAGGQATVDGLSRQSLQGDIAFADVLAQMGCDVEFDDVHNRTTVRSGALHGTDVNMNAISDTVQTLGAVALFADGPTTITGVGHIRHKETDRIAAMATELRKLGATVEEFADGMKITPGPLHGAAIDTYDDHRMAMSLALAGLRIPGVVINDPGCTAKTYPEFFQDLASLK
ncbi:MAG: 3-phosphoshikimate 1-carboxyvinyltransferase [Planctomycetia bacterium]|nr:3-phosphoshikimate 1-carboxyvinyltransferase [Planctomycetia bacterium]